VLHLVQELTRQCPAVPPALVLAAAGLRFLCQTLGGLTPQPVSVGRLQAAAVVLLALLFLPHALEIEKKRQYGLIAAAGEVWSQRIGANPSVLIASDVVGEGATIAELAMRDPNPPSLFAVRGSRLLGGGGYNASEYVPLFETAEQVMAQIDQFAIPLVLYRSTGKAGEWAHLQQIEEARMLYPDRWQLVYHLENPAGNILLFRIRGNDARAADSGSSSFRGRASRTPSSTSGTRCQGCPPDTFPACRRTTFLPFCSRPRGSANFALSTRPRSSAFHS
jgi:hypothetical protein